MSESPNNDLTQSDELFAFIAREVRGLASERLQHEKRLSEATPESVKDAIRDTARLLEAAGIGEQSIPRDHWAAIICAVGNTDRWDRAGLVAALAWLKYESKNSAPRDGNAGACAERRAPNV